MQNFPNPFNNSTVISYTLPEKMEVTLQVFDILGRQVATLVEGKQEPGVKSIRFDASGLSTGAYFYRLTTSTKTDVRKMIYLR
jgi:hypothetical protein